MAKKKIRLLKDVHFDFDGAHIALTSKGAASQVDEPFLLKSLDVEESNAAGTATGNTGVTKAVESADSKQTDEDVMSQEVIKQLEDQLAAVLAERDAEKVAVAVVKAAAVFGKYDLDEELVKELSETFHTDQQALVIKTLDAMVAKQELAITKAKEINPAKEEIELAKEKGDGAQPEADVEVQKTIVQLAQEALAAKLEKK